VKSTDAPTLIVVAALLAAVALVASALPAIRAVGVDRWAPCGRSKPHGMIVRIGELVNL